jgi:hypothetical protein
MPDWKSLRVGDQIRLLCVPKADLEQRVCEVRDGAEMAGWTADTLERIIASDPVVFIERIDEYWMSLVRTRVAVSRWRR